jgi:hypothetical protein
MSIERPEYATPATKHLRERIDRAGIGWKSGVFPNVETCLSTLEMRTGRAASVTALELDNGMFSLVYCVDGMSEDDVMFALIEGVKFDDVIGWESYGKD